jgi:hypothetical protein
MNAFLLPATARVLISLVCFLLSGCNAFSSIAKNANSHHLSGYSFDTCPGYFSGTTHFIRSNQFSNYYLTTEKGRCVNDWEGESSENRTTNTRIDFLTANLVKPGELHDSLLELPNQSNSDIHEIPYFSSGKFLFVLTMPAFLRSGILRM